MPGLKTRLQKLERDAGRPENIETLSDEDLTARIRELCETIAAHPDSTPEDKALAKSELERLDAEEMEQADDEKS